MKVKNFNEYLNESKNVDYEKMFGNKVKEINELIQKAKDDSVYAIETDSTWESTYEFDKVELTKTKLKCYYTDENKKKVDEISLAKDSLMNFEESKYLFQWIKKCIKKGYRYQEKENKKEQD